MDFLAQKNSLNFLMNQTIYFTFEIHQTKFDHEKQVCKALV